jgi:predicted benzoate:H+ symporter BenE
VQPGDDESRSELRRFSVDVMLGGTRVVAGLGAIVLGIVGLLILREGSLAALALLIPAGLLGVAALTIDRRRHGADVDES